MGEYGTIIAIMVVVTIIGFIVSGTKTTKSKNSGQYRKDK